MKIALKHSVVPNLSVEAAVMLGWIAAQWDNWILIADNGPYAIALGEFVVTSAKDGRHMAGSDHKQDEPDGVPGNAFDIRTRHLFDATTGAHQPALIEFAKYLQSRGAKVVVHPDWVPGTPHLHVALGKESLFRRVE